jgi:hypothetical protein
VHIAVVLPTRPSPPSPLRPHHVRGTGIFASVPPPLTIRPQYRAGATSPLTASFRLSSIAVARGLLPILSLFLISEQSGCSGLHLRHCVGDRVRGGSHWRNPLRQHLPGSLHVMTVETAVQDWSIGMCCLMTC